MLWESILLQELVFDDVGDFQSQLLIFREGVSTDQLHDFVKFDFFLQNFFDSLSKGWELLIKLVEIGFKLLFVTGCGDSPVDWREMLLLSKFFVQPPEDLYDGEGGSSDWISEVTTRRTDSTDDGNWTLSVWRSEASDFSCSFVELGQLGGQIGWISRVSGHFSQSTWNFSQGFCPSGSGIGHHRDISSHISEILSKSDSCVNGGFSGSDRHVGSIGDKRGSLHDGDLFTILDGGEFWEFFQDFSHFISSFSTTDVDNDLTVGMFRQGLGNTSFSTSEGAGNSTGSSQNWREHGVQDSLTSNQGNISCKFFNNGSGLSDRPFVTHLILGSNTINFEFQNFFVDVVLSWWSNVSDSSFAFGRDQDAVFGEETVFVDGAENISLWEDITLFDFSGFELPEFGWVERGDVDSLWYEDGLGVLSNDLEGSLNSVENLIEDTWTKFNW